MNLKGALKYMPGAKNRGDFHPMDGTVADIASALYATTDKVVQATPLNDLFVPAFSNFNVSNVIELALASSSIYTLTSHFAVPGVEVY